jgi:hypothetical protein
MSADRELLELAAKAAGIKHSPSLSAACRGERIYWNPLTDDGDAMRLAVKLGLHFIDIDIQLTGWTCISMHEGVDDVLESHGNDPYAATRRAIVRAAAEIGKQA